MDIYLFNFFNMYYVINKVYYKLIWTDPLKHKILLPLNKKGSFASTSHAMPLVIALSVKILNLEADWGWCWQ